MKEFFKYLILIILLTGCANLKEVDVSLTGIELEYYEPPVPQPEKNVAPLTSWPKLMPMNNKDDR